MATSSTTQTYGHDQGPNSHPAMTALAAALAAATERLGVPVKDLEILRLEQEQWDGCLGCPEPDEICPLVVVTGLAVVVDGAGQRLEYHAAYHGSSGLRLCPTYKIRFKRSGGLAGQLLEASLDTAELSGADTRRLRQLINLARFFELPPTIQASTGADAFVYEVTVEDAEHRHTVKTDDIAAPETLRPLLDWLAERAQGA